MIKNQDCTNCLIRPYSCFKELTDNDLQDINGFVSSNFYKKGQIIFHEGQIPTGIYCLKSGKIKVCKIGIDGKEQIVRFVLPGALLGLRAFVSGRNYAATAATLEDSVVCFIEKKVFFNLIAKFTSISQCILYTLGKLLEEAENKMISLAQKPVRERLAESLLILNKVFKAEHCQTESATIALSREDLANIVGTATETVIRILSEFKEEKLIAIIDRKIILRDIKGLYKAANLPL
ncbi:MAG: Crp/Fnr family transcriptional regulator [Bacteroidales bacterium]|nr:Crp/Fnr family transcriptional regulator [Bacteroidales bacterium]